MMKTSFHIKRIYEAPRPEDGFRALADRLWPRGMKKEDAAIGEWAKDLAPSAGLRQWFHQGKGTWEQFREQYLDELKENEAVADFLDRHQDQQKITLLYAAKDETQNHALILQHFLEQFRK